MAVNERITLAAGDTLAPAIRCVCGVENGLEIVIAEIKRANGYDAGAQRVDSVVLVVRDVVREKAADHA